MARSGPYPPSHRPGRSGTTPVAVSALLSLAISGCAPSAIDLGHRALEQGDPAGALGHFEQSIESEESVFRSLRGRGAARLELGDPRAALEDLELARSIRSGDPTLLWLLGRAYEDAGQAERAVAAYEDYALVSDERTVRRLLRRKLAELRHQSTQTGANRLLALLDSSDYEPDPRSVAIYAFVPTDTASTRDRELCRALTVFVSDDLAKVEALEIIAADQIDRIYEQLEFTYANRQFFDSSTFVTPGNLFPARHMVRGILASSPDRHIALGLERSDALDRETRELTTERGSLDDIFRLEARIVLGLLEDLRIPFTEEEKRAIQKKPTRYLEALLAFGHGLHLREQRDLTGARAAFREAVSIDPGFQLAQAAAEDVEVELEDRGTTRVPPPKSADAAEVRALRSAGHVGIGLLPEEEHGSSTDATTENNTAVHGEVTIEVRGSIGGGAR